MTIVSAITVTTTPTSDDRILILDDPLGTPSVKTTTAANLQLATGRIQQVVNTQVSAVATGTTTIPLDDTIPQNTEGDQYMSLSITPTSATNILHIDVTINLAVNNNHFITAALFQDSTANALAAVTSKLAGTDDTEVITFRHKMTAGTTSATTFKVRAGANAAGTTTFNGRAGARLFGGVMASSITITEILV